MKRVAVFASGRGSNLSALLRDQAAYDSYRVALVISNVPGSGALNLATEASIEALLIPSRGIERSTHESLVLAALQSRSIDIVCLAGYMRVLGSAFIDGFKKPILNIHPSLLPSFPGMHAQKQAVDAGVRWSGATVHFVDGGLDSGPIILQEPVEVCAEDDEDRLSSRILQAEHQIYPRALDIVARGVYRLQGRVVRF
ncbi:MAG: phosphoribosylglycinamide formyltransferase [Vicinamibacteria bacterium]